MWVLIIFIVLFVIVKIISKENDTQQPKKIYSQEEADRKRGYKYLDTYVVDYLGGFSSLEPQNDINLAICNDRLELKGKSTRTIMYKGISNISLQTETQIKEKVSLGKLICFGILAFGMKGKESVNIKNYIVIECTDNETSYAILLSGNNNNDIIGKINKNKLIYEKELEEYQIQGV